MNFSVSDMEKMHFFKGLKQSHLEKINPLFESKWVQAKEIIFKAGDPAKDVYLLRQGKILLQTVVSPILTISFTSINPGNGFGWSGLLNYSVRTFQAVSDGRSEILQASVEKLLNLFEQNHVIGYYVMRNLAILQKGRSDNRTIQLTRLLAKHPDLEKAMSGIKEDEFR